MDKQRRTVSAKPAATVFDSCRPQLRELSRIALGAGASIFGPMFEAFLARRSGRVVTDNIAWNGDILSAV